MDDYKTSPLDDWTEDHVREWLRSIRIKTEYIDKLFDEEVTGPVLKKIKDEFLKSLGMKQGQIQLLIEERNELVKKHKVSPSPSRNSQNTSKLPSLDMPACDDVGHQVVQGMGAASHSETSRTTVQPGESHLDVEKECLTSKEEVSPLDKAVAGTNELDKSEHTNNSGSVFLPKFRPFDKEVGNFKYVKGHVLPPESGVEDLITPCHEYKSLLTASKLDRERLQTKFAFEVIKFSSACLNMRTNGTIHFGVMDSKEDKCYKHGQIMGIVVKDQDWYVDALDCIEKCFNERDAARACIRTPKFIQVVDNNRKDQCFVIEVDVVPDSGSVKGRVFQTSLPKFNEKTNKRIQEKKTYYRRIGAKSVPVLEDDVVVFIQKLQQLDEAREKAERSVTCEMPPIEDLGRKISVLLTDGKKYIDDSLRYILVTNQCTENQLMHVNFLMHMNILCVFDFDPSSDSKGLCSKYKEHHAINIHSLKSYSKEGKDTTGDLKNKLSLFNQTSWIFCNGRSNYRGGDEPCDANTWVRTKRKLLKKAITFICDEILPRGYFIVVFLLLSSVEKPIIDTFHEFYTELNGMDYIICVAENKEDYETWAHQAQDSCIMEILEKRSIVGMQLSHIDATIQNLLPLSSSIRQLSVSTKGLCVLTTPDEERMHSLEILCANECDNTNLEDLNKEQIEEMETTFYRGGKVSWKHFWLAEQGKCEAFIEREACSEVESILNDILYGNRVRLPVATIKIVHQPGSGGSTVARQILWKKRKVLRCAVLKFSFVVMTACAHAVNFREYEEKDNNLCLPVLLLIEDCDDEYIADLRHELTKVMVSKKIAPSKLCFILLSCKRANAPEKLSRFSTETVAITHKLSKDEKTKFTTKAEKLKKQFSPESIITFILMSQEFVEEYVTNFVHNVMENVDHSSNVTRLMRYVALLNSYIQNSYISVSHCEAFMGLEAHTKNPSELRQYNFNSCLSEQAKLIFIERVDPITFINCIHIIHPYVAQEILKQLPDNPQSQIAMGLLLEDVLFHHRFGRDQFLGFIRDLIFRRRKISRGDSVDSFLSPLIDYVCEEEKNQEKAIELLKVAYERFDKDAFLAQQLARLHYKYEKFEDAIHWAETAKSQQPHDSFILDTEGQVYKNLFSSLVDKRNNVVPLEDVPKFIEHALKAMQCFRAAQKAARDDSDTMNNSGYFGEVDVGCRLIKLLSTLHIFPQNKNAESHELLRYLLTDYIPEPIKKPWSKYHSHLKGLHQNIYNALEWISEDLSYFQTDKSEDKEENSKVEEQVNSPRKWLLHKIKVFAKFFSSQLLLSSENGDDDINAMNKLIQKMTIYRLGGGSNTAILSLLSDNANSRKKLSNIVDLYTKCTADNNLDEIDLINYIMSHIALACVSPDSPKLLKFEQLRDCSKRFQNPRKSFPASAYLLLMLLYWKDDIVDKVPDAAKDRILSSSLQNARRLHEIRLKNVPVRKKRSNVLFFLGHGYGLHKLLHRSTVEKHMEGPVNEWRLKLNDGDVGKLDSGQKKLLRTVPGFAENGKIYATGHCERERIEIVPINNSSVPYGNENVTFYLGFTYAGLLAYNIKVQ